VSVESKIAKKGKVAIARIESLVVVTLDPALNTLNALPYRCCRIR
jgi:hypothetical protein